MANIKEAFGTIGQTITITTDSLAASVTVGRASTVIDNSSNLYLDALLSGVLVTSSSALANSKSAYIFAYAQLDSTPHYTDGVSGSDAGFTRTDPPNLPFVAQVNLPATNTTYRFGPYSIAVAFGGVLPDHWGIVVFNDTGQNFNTGTSFTYQGVYATSA